MYNHIINFFRWLFPIVRTAVVQVAADEINRVAYPRPRVRYYGGDYNRIGVRPGPGSIPRPRTYGSADHSDLGFKERTEPGFHDVLMVAFDVTADDRAAAEAFILNYMPETGRQTFGGSQINLDSFWVADDGRLDDSDTDSAVFVPKGSQDRARRVLKAYL